jgi:hypothetical protein
VSLFLFGQNRRLGDFSNGKDIQQRRR